MDDAVTRTITRVHERYAGLADGALADYIPELTRADPRGFGIAVVTADGHRYRVGDVEVPFTIQSVSKAFAYALAVDLHGAAEVEKRVDVEPSGEAFNSISLDAETGRPRNPMINAGAIAITGMLPTDEHGSRFPGILTAFSRLAGRELQWDEQVYASESTTGHRNRAIANMLRAVEVIGDPVDDIVEDYFRQCSVLVTADDLAMMAATLANGGVHPLTRDRVVGADAVERALSVMSTCGMYDYSGTWMYEVGVPAKSGVGGGVTGVLPGQLAVAAWSPLLDAKGNSVRGVAAIRDISRVLDLHLLRASSTAAHALRRSYRLSDIVLSRRRPPQQARLLAAHGHRTAVHELQGDLFAAPLERLVREVHRTWGEVDAVVLDLTRAGSTDGSTTTLLRGLARDLTGSGQRLLVADPAGVLGGEMFTDAAGVQVTGSLDDALLVCEEAVLHATDALEDADAEVPLEDFELVRHLGEHAQARLLHRFERRTFRPGDELVTEGAPTDALHLLAAGRVRVEVADEHGSRVRVADMFPGTAFGELGLIEQAPRSASVRAVDPVVTWELTRDQLMEVRRVDHLVFTRILEHLLVGLADRLRETTHEAVSLRD